MKKIFFVLLFLIFHSNDLPCSVPSGKFLNFSDIHFDPFLDSALIYKLDNSAWTEWENIFESTSATAYSTYGQDCNYPLLKSSLLEMKSRIPKPDFIIITGDFMSHNFNENYFHFIKTDDTLRLNGFIEKTMRFIASFITKQFSDVPIFSSVGNDDAYCGNYMVEPDGDFLKMLADTWEPWINKAGINGNFKSGFSKGGYCMLNFPGKEDFKMIILNTVFFSYKYENRCGDLSADPGLDELNWLKHTLDSCRQNNFRVYLSYHIPPGADIYGTIHKKADCQNKYFNSWKENYNNMFIDITEQYSDEIISAFAGHFHRDDYRVFINERRLPVSYLLVTPSISPVYDNNPSYKIFSYDTSGFNIINFDSYYLPVNDVSVFSEWRFQYDFKSAYRLNDISPESIMKIFGLINSDTTFRNNYIRFYIASNERDFAEDLLDWKYNYCGISFLKKDNYTNCLCNDRLK